MLIKNNDSALYCESAIRPKKSLGQNFLTDKNALTKIVNLCEIQPQEVVLEIGSGTGLLTEKLLPKVSKLYAVEIDNSLFQRLVAKFAASLAAEPGKLVLINDDILKLDFNRLDAEKMRIIANVPYYISTKIIKKVIDNLTKIEDVILLLQKEFGEKLMAKPKNKNYTSLTLFVNYFFEVKKLMEVKNTCFCPKPKVDSVLVRLIPRKKPLFQVQEDDFFNLIRSCFHLRRKFLLNSLAKSPYLKLTPGYKEIDFFKRNDKIRAEELALADYYQLYLGIKEFILG